MGHRAIYCHFQDEDPFPRSVVRELFDRYPDVQAAFAKRGIFVIEFQIGSVDFDEPISAADAAAQAWAACHYPAARHASTLFFIAHGRPEVARMLAADPPRVPRGVFLGACGYLEGGVDFWGANGTLIKSDDWEAARAFALDAASST